MVVFNHNPSSNTVALTVEHIKVSLPNYAI